MRIGIISAEATSDDQAENVRLSEQITLRGHTPQIINYQNTVVKFDETGVRLCQFDGEAEFTPIEVDKVIPRINEGDFTSVVMGILAIDTLVAGGTKSTASANAVLVAKDKARAQLAFSRAGLATPNAIAPLRTGVSDPAALLKAVEPNPLFKIVIKDRYGTLGDEVRILDSRASARTVVGSIYTPQVVQRFIESKGFPEIISDHRIIVIGSKAVAGFIREVPATVDLRANVSQNGRAIEYEPSEEEKELAERATSAVGLSVAGVDVFPPTENHGFLINEVNASPGFGIGSVPKLDIAAAIVDYAISL